MWKGLEASDKLFGEEAATLGLSLEQHRSDLKRRYRAALEAIKAVNAGKDRESDSEGTGQEDRGQQSKNNIH